MNQYIFAIDPGRVRCGIALMDDLGQTRVKKIINTSELIEQMKELIYQHPAKIVLLGKGTYSKSIKNSLKEILGEIPLELRDEKYSSERARKRFLLEHPARGLEKLIPQGMRLPDQPYDDYAAEILAEEYLKEKKLDQGGNK